jgi:effector-binding domain-containing protein
MRPLEPPAEIKELAESGEIRVKTTEPLQVVYLVHKGSYANMAESFMRLLRWIAENDYEVMGPGINIYHNDPMMVRSEEELITEVQFPIRKKEMG